MKEKLLNQSKAAAQRAIRHYLNNEQDQFLMQAALCFELLGKARLVAIHPALIVDRDFDSLLHACSASNHAKRPPWNIKTINTTEVLLRCTQLHPQLNEFGTRLRLLADLRNSAVHLGDVVEKERKEIFHELLASTCLIVDEMGIARADFFGEFAELVATHLDKSLKEVNRLTAEKIAHAKTAYAQKYGVLDSEHAQAIIKMVEAGYTLDGYEDQLAACPACGNQGTAHGAIDVRWEADFDRWGNVEGGYPIVTLEASSFDCKLCGLSLSGSSELQAAGFNESIDVEDFDPADFYDPPDYY